MIHIKKKKKKQLKGRKTLYNSDHQDIIKYIRLPMPFPDKHFSMAYSKLVSILTNLENVYFGKFVIKKPLLKKFCQSHNICEENFARHILETVY